jgi:type I restriction enzyme M protein
LNDASKGVEKQKNQNNLRPGDIQKIIDVYKGRESEPKYAHLADYDEIVRNDYNLNIPRYVDTFEEEEQIDIVALSQKIVELNAQIKENDAAFLALLEELAVTDETEALIEATKKYLNDRGIYG